MKEVKLNIELIQVLLNYLGTKPSNEAGDFFSSIKSVTEKQLKEYQNKEDAEKLEKAIEEKLKAEKKD